MTLGEPTAVPLSGSADEEMEAAGAVRRAVPDRAYQLAGKYGALAVLVAMCAAFAIAEPSTFLTSGNLINILSQNALAAFVALGLTFALAAGEFDLSLGYVASLAGVVGGVLIQNDHWNIGLAILASVLAGVVVGAINGLVVTQLRINALVATLGVGTIAVGVTYALNGGALLTITNPSFQQVTYGRFLQLPYPVWICIGLSLVMWVVFNRTTFGQALQAVGGNPVAAEMSGLRTSRIRVSVFVISAGSAALAGVLLASSSGSAAVDAGTPYLLNAFAAVFFGTALLREGQFHIVGTLFGVLTIAVGGNGIILVGIGSYWQYMFEGLLLVFGVGVGTLSLRRVRQT
jgi:ribose transport system permease protein